MSAEEASFLSYNTISLRLLKDLIDFFGRMIVFTCVNIESKSYV